MPRRNYPYTDYDESYDREFESDYHQSQSHLRPPARGTRRPYELRARYNEPTRRQYQGTHLPTEYPSQKSTGKAFAVALVVIILIIAVLASASLLINTLGPLNEKYREVPEGLNVTLKKEARITTVSPNGTTTSFTYKVAIPRDRNIAEIALQDVQGVTPTPRPDNGYPDMSSSEQAFMIWEEDNFRGSKTITITYTLRTKTHIWDITEEDSGTLDDIPQDLKDQYLTDEWRIDYNKDNYLDANEDIDGDGEWDYLIEMSDPKIEARAESLTEDENNVYLNLKTIYDYLTASENLNYVTKESKSIPQDCLSTLKILQGDCDDYSILFVALCRAAGIPTWLELGIIYDPEVGRWGGHAWTKVFIPFNDGTYTIATIDIVNREFLIHDAYRITEWVDTGGDLFIEGKNVNNLEYYYHSFTYIIRNNGNGDSFPILTESYVTQEYRELGDTIKLPIEESEDGESQSIPSFGAGILIISVLVILFIKIKKNREWGLISNDSQLRQLASPSCLALKNPSASSKMGNRPPRPP
ncbi:MAG: transglutaminase domain-containing protein [Thermoplasmata archaeon]|nr:transglutaminase domain-containing protein [Thermoplasmata archaeon]